MLHCADRSFYVGHTDDLQRRVGQHEQGTIPGYTQSRRPLALVWSEVFETRDEAREAERKLKGWGRPKKLALIRGDWALIQCLARSGKERASTSSAKADVEDRLLPTSTGLAEPVEAPRFFFLHPHPETLPSQPFSLEVSIRQSHDSLRLRYRLTGSLDKVVIPLLRPTARADGLWQSTCFEAFVRPGDAAAYHEYNFASSTEWAAYRFDAYRQGMAMLETPEPFIRVSRTPHTLEVTATISRSDGKANLALSAVIEETGGTKSYWALAHPPGAPDFHHPDCFVLTLPAATQP